MKRSQTYILLTAVLTLLFIMACAPKPGVAVNGTANTSGANSNGTNSGVANSGQPKNPEEAKSTKAFPEMPAIIMKTDLKALDGTTFKLKDLEGKTVMVNLWATWCGPCRMEMPELIKIENDYKDKGFMIVGLDVDPEPEEAVKTFVEKQQLNYKIGWAPREVYSSLLEISKVAAIPQSFIISKDGRLAAVFKGYDPTATPQKVRIAVDDALARTTE